MRPPIDRIRRCSKLQEHGPQSFVLGRKRASRILSNETAVSLVYTRKSSELEKYIFRSFFAVNICVNTKCDLRPGTASGIIECSPCLLSIDFSVKMRASRLLKSAGMRHAGCGVVNAGSRINKGCQSRFDACNSREGCLAHKEAHPPRTLQ